MVEAIDHVKVERVGSLDKALQVAEAVDHDELVLRVELGARRVDQRVGNSSSQPATLEELALRDCRTLQ